MTKPTLFPTLPMDGFDQSWGSLRLREVPARSLISLATPLGGEEAFAAFLAEEFGLSPVAPGETQTQEGKTLLGLAHDQSFLVLPFSSTPLSPGRVSAAQGRAYLTDQSDSWAHLEIVGPDVRTALERICPLNLAPDRFAIGAVARTAMERLNVIIWRADSNRFNLMSGRSSARSFLHAVKVSIENTRC